MIFDGWHQQLFLVLWLLIQHKLQGPDKKEIILNFIIISVYNKILDFYWFSLSICHITGVRSRGCPTTAFQFQLFVIIGYLCHFHVNYVYFNGFL